MQRLAVAGRRAASVLSQQGGFQRTHKAFFSSNPYEEASKLCNAAAVGDIEFIKNAVAKGANVNSSDYDKRTALHVAAVEGKVDIVDFLIKSGANVNAVDRWGNTPIENAALGKHEQVLKLLTKAGGFAIPSHEHEIVTHLCTAASAGDLEGVKSLVNAGADINKGDYDYRTPLHLAAAEGRLEVAEYLISRGADVNVVDRFGNTPLIDAQRGGHKAVIKLLQEKGGIADKDLWRSRNAPEFQSSLQKSLPLLAERGRWIYAESWLPSEDGASLNTADPWYAAREFVNSFTPFRQQAETISTKNTNNVLVRALIEKKPIWIKDKDFKDSLQRGELAANLQVKTGLALPVVVNDRVLSVLFFLSEKDREENAKELEQLSIFARGLISSGFSKQPRFEATAHSEQMNTVYSLIVEEGVFNANLIYEEVDWYFNNLKLQEYYFQRFSPQTIAKHLHSYIAAKKLAQTTGRPEDLWLTMEQKDGSESFYLCPSDYESTVTIERKLEKLIERVPANKAYTLTYFQSKGTAIPNGQKHLGLYIFDKVDYITPMDQVSESETDIWKVATGAFLRDKTPAIRDRYQEIIKKAQSKLSPVLEVFPTYRDGTIPIMFAFKKGAQSSYLQKLTEILKYNHLTCERKFIETFSNGLVVYSLYLHPPSDMKKINDLLDEVSLLYTVPISSLTPSFLSGVYTAEQYTYASAVSRFIYYFMNKPSEDFVMLAKAFKDDPLNMSRLNGLQNRLRREAVSLNRILECVNQHASLVNELFEDFTAVSSNASAPAVNKELVSKIKKAVENELDEQILLAIATFNAHILKTNFYRQRKSALSFRLNPEFLKQGNFPEIPYGLFFVMGSDFHGFHVRFRDVARGGIRIIRSSNIAVYNRNLETLFSENYGLAYTQNKKNKDIPEFGSKGTVLLNPEPASQNYPFISFQKYTSGLLDLLIKDPTIVDRYGKEEILFLGPDEGTADYMKWAAEYARKRGYRFWKAFTTGKPPSLGGVPHDTYGMTTRSVHRYVVGCLQKKGLIEEQVTKLQTGGPDGDLGSNEILLSKDKTTTIVDGSGVLYDPNGIDRNELTRLAHARKMINAFDVSKLSKEGFRVLVSDRDVKLPNGEYVESGLTFRNEFHLHPLSTADLFVPCGGRPESVNLSNVHRLFHADGTPRFKIIVEGANLFFTNDARMVMEKAGVILYKDASANKGGVTSSSLEVLAALSMNDAEFSEHMQVLDPANAPKFYQTYVQEIQTRIEENADLEFECIWKEHELTKTPRHVLTDKVSDKINSLNDMIQESVLWHNVTLRHRVLDEAIPRTLINLLGLETILKRVPENYVRAIFGAYLASRYVYKHGLSANEFAFFEFMQHYLKTV